MERKSKEGEKMWVKERKRREGQMIITIKKYKQIIVIKRCKAIKRRYYSGPNGRIRKNRIYDRKCKEKKRKEKKRWLITKDKGMEGRQKRRRMIKLEPNDGQIDREMEIER